MSRADKAYLSRRAEEEQALTNRAGTVEARAAHQQLRDLYLVRLGRLVEGSDMTIFASHDA